jgi:hypothetical protein
MYSYKNIIAIVLILLTVYFVFPSCRLDLEIRAKRLAKTYDLKNEPSMTEDEILLFIKITPEFAAAEGDLVKEMEFYKKYNLTKNRHHYLTAKIAIASLIATDRRPKNLGRFPESLQPNDGEVEIVKKYLLPITGAANRYEKTKKRNDKTTS